jgi:glycerol-3-phosphate O-acyltransferase
MDLYRLLRTGGNAPAVPLDELAEETDRVLAAVRRLPSPPRLSEELEQDPRSIVDDALRAYGCYHKRPAAVRRGDRIFHEDRNLLLFYGNRLRGYDLGRALA